jgi:transcriptional antiterminator RfaH
MPRVGLRRVHEEDPPVPILPPEPSCFPSTLLEDPQAPPDSGQRWRVLHTRPRQEKSLARQLHSAQVPYYLPTVPNRSLVRGKVVEAHVPLFPGYLFVRGSREDWLEALATRRVVQTLDVVDQAGLHHDLRQVFKLIASGTPVSREGRLVPGAVVEVRSGPLAGLKGKILQAASGRRFVVQVDFIMQGASVLLDDFYLTVIEAADHDTTPACGGAGTRRTGMHAQQVH